MFQSIAAKILGITLTRIQVESTHKTIKAQIVKTKEPTPVKPVQQPKSGICTVQ